MAYKIDLTLKSDTTFGRGDGVAGLIDAEVEHDEFGLPFLRGRALKGLLAEECVNILFSLKAVKEQGKLSEQKFEDLKNAARKLFGVGGSDLQTDAKMHVGDAKLPEALRQAVRYEIQEKQLTADEVLASLTAIRRQTAMTERGAPKENSLRSMRVVVRETVFESELMFDEAYQTDSDAIILLSACCASLQRVGLGRNRGRGRVQTKLIHNGDITQGCLNLFEREIAQ